MSEPEHRLRPLIDPRSIAILGASVDPSRVGGMPLHLLQMHGFAGPIYPINPKYEEISGLACYPDIEALPEAVDLIALAVSARDVVPQLRRAAARGIRSAVVFASGFAETGDEEGRLLQDEFEACVADLGIPVAGPNCMGFANLKSQAYTAFASVFRNVAPPADDFSAALVTQSGNVCSAVYAMGRKLGVGFGSVINTGNEATIEFAEYLDYFANDPAIQVIGGYVEGLRDGDRFRRVALRLQAERRPLILLKIGDTEKGAEAAASHTAALAGSAAVYRAVFETLNIVQADDLAHLADLMYLARFREKSMGSRMAILTISGALGALLADKFVKFGADVPTLPADVQAVLRSGIPSYGMVANPVDLTGNVVNKYDFIAEALATLQASCAIDTIVVYAPGYLLDRLAPAMVASAATGPKMIAAIDTGNSTSKAMLEAGGIPVFDDTGRGVAALSSFSLWAERNAHASRAAASGAIDARPEASSILAQAKAAGAAALDEVAGKRIIAAYGVPVVAELQAADEDGAARAASELGFPVVVKVLSADILHKSDCGGVKLNLSTREQVHAAYRCVTAAALRAYPDADIAGVVVQRQEPTGLEVLVGVTRDPVFGPVMTVGLGGVFTEVLRDIQHRPLPVSADEARLMLKRLKGYPLFEGVRGQPPRDVDALADAMAAVSSTCLAHPEIEELELNPIVLRESSQGLTALDCLITLGKPPAHDASAPGLGICLGEPA